MVAVAPYVVALSAGLVLLIVFAFGGEVDTDMDGDFDGDTGESKGRSLFSWVSISAVSFGAVFFGIAGVAATWLEVAPVPRMLISVGAGALAMAFHNALFGWLRRTSASSEITGRDLTGVTGVVVLGAHRDQRGQIVVDAAGQRLRLTASPHNPDDRFETGERAKVVKTEGAVALLGKAPPERKPSK